MPVVSVLMFIVYDFWRLMTTNDANFQWIVFPEAILILPGTLIIVAAFASILGMQMSLRCRTTVRAVMSSVASCWAFAARWDGADWNFCRAAAPTATFSLILSSFSPFTVMTVLIDPASYGGRLFERQPR